MPPDSALEAHHFEALGTACSVYAVGQNQARLVDAESWVRRLGARLTRFDTHSELSVLNRRAGEWVEVSPDMESVLQAALEAFTQSLGLVNIAVLPSMLAAGYIRTLAEGTSEVALAEAHPLPSLRSVLEIRAGEARVARGAGIDLGGIAKGWMADRLCTVLGPNCVVNLGGDLFAAGDGPRGGGWPVGFAGSTLLLRNQGAATSSVRRRRWGDVHHLIDPRTGLPSRTGLEEVSVVGATGLDAEIAAKTALLLGPDLAPAYCATQAMAWWLSGERDD